MESDWRILEFRVNASKKKLKLNRECFKGGMMLVKTFCPPSTKKLLNDFKIRRNYGASGIDILESRHVGRLCFWILKCGMFMRVKNVDVYICSKAFYDISVRGNIGCILFPSCRRSGRVVDTAGLPKPLNRLGTFLK